MQNKSIYAPLETSPEIRVVISHRGQGEFQFKAPRNDVQERRSISNLTLRITYTASHAANRCELFLHPVGQGSDNSFGQLSMVPKFQIQVPTL